MQTLTATYPLDQMAVGDSFTVTSRFQHARVAASEYARKHGMAFSCRMQDDGTMRVFRCENNQAIIDTRGSRGKRRIVQAVAEPNANQFHEWLMTFSIGQSYVMPASYHHLFTAMIAWCELACYKTWMRFTADRINDTLVIRRTI